MEGVAPKLRLFCGGDEIIEIPGEVLAMRTDHLYGITVKNALSLDVLRGIKVLGGESGLDRVITSVNVMEVPDILPWVKPGQLLLTTAFSIKDDLAAQERLIPELYHKGLAGLMIKPKRYLSEVPEVMVKAANECALPLLEMPQHLSHPMVLEAVYEALVNRQSITLRRSVEAHQRLMQVVLGGGGLSEICDALRDACGNPVAIIGDDGTVLAAAAKGIVLDEMTKWLEEVVAKYRGLLSRRVVENEIAVENGKIPVVSTPIMVGVRYHGSIYVFGKDQCLREMDYVVIEQAATVAALLIVHSSSIHEIESRYRNEFLFDWMNGRVDSEAQLTQRATLIGWDLRYSFVLILAAIDGYAELLATDSQASHEAQRLKRVLQKAVSSVLERRHSGFISGDQGETVLILVPFLGSNRNDDATRQATHIADRIADEFGNRTDFTCSFGIGHYRPGLMEIPLCFREAKKAIEIARAFRRAGQVTSFDSLGVYRLLFKANKEDLQRFVEDFYLPLVGYDIAHNTELVETAREFFKCNGNVSQTAKALFAHYNTVVHRIHRIEEITGLDLSSSEDRLNLQLALKAALGVD